jgi:hypothetical protein
LSEVEKGWGNETEKGKETGAKDCNLLGQRDKLREGKGIN